MWSGYSNVVALVAGKWVNPKWSLLSQLFHCFGHVLNIFDSFLLCVFVNHFNLRIAVVFAAIVVVVVVALVVCLWPSPLWSKVCLFIWLWLLPWFRLGCFRPLSLPSALCPLSSLSLFVSRFFFSLLAGVFAWLSLIVNMACGFFIVAFCRFPFWPQIIFASPTANFWRGRGVISMLQSFCGCQ